MERRKEQAKANARSAHLAGARTPRLAPWTTDGGTFDAAVVSVGRSRCFPPFRAVEKDEGDELTAVVGNHRKSSRIEDPAKKERRERSISAIDWEDERRTGRREWSRAWGNYKSQPQLEPQKCVELCEERVSRQFSPASPKPPRSSARPSHCKAADQQGEHSFWL